MAEITKRILLFLISLVLIILYLVSATTSHAKDEFEVDIKEDNLRFFTMEWIDVIDDNNRNYVCGTKVSTFDYTGRKIVFEYYYIITKDNEIVTGIPAKKFGKNIHKVDLTPFKY